MATVGALELDVLIEEDGWRALLPGAGEHCRRAAEVAFRRLWRQRQPAEASLMLTDDARVRILNRDYRGRDAPTNVLSFPLLDPRLPQVPEEEPEPELGEEEAGAAADAATAVLTDDGPPVPLGDIVIALETTRRQAVEEGKTLADHLSHLVVHGILHLLGYDHQTDEEATIMEGLEARALADLGVADPYATGDDP